MIDGGCGYQKRSKYMTKKQRVGLVILMCVLIMVILFGNKPDLTIETWRQMSLLSGLLGGFGGSLFIFK